MRPTSVCKLLNVGKHLALPNACHTRKYKEVCKIWDFCWMWKHIDPSLIVAVWNSALSRCNRKSWSTTPSLPSPHAWSFLCYLCFESVKNGTILICLCLWCELMVNNPVAVKECNQHCELPGCCCYTLSRYTSSLVFYYEVLYGWVIERDGAFITCDDELRQSTVLSQSFQVLSTTATPEVLLHPGEDSGDKLHSHFCHSKLLFVEYTDDFFKPVSWVRSQTLVHLPRAFTGFTAEQGLTLHSWLVFQIHFTTMYEARHLWNHFSSGRTPKPAWIALKSFLCNLDLHYFILEQLSVKFGFPFFVSMIQQKIVLFYLWPLIMYWIALNLACWPLTVNSYIRKTSQFWTWNELWKQSLKHLIICLQVDGWLVLCLCSFGDHVSNPLVIKDEKQFLNWRASYPFVPVSHFVRVVAMHSAPQTSFVCQ